MYIAISEFRVANGMEDEVREAFRHRAHLVDDQPGFLGLEVFSDADDPTVFRLLTRWSDRESFRAWHRSDAHRASHAGIPKGLKLDPSRTRIVSLVRIEEEEPAAEHQVIDQAGLLASFLEDSDAICQLSADRTGMITRCNSTLAQRLRRREEQLVGQPLASLLAPVDARWLAAQRGPTLPQTCVLTFLDADAESVGVRAHFQFRPDGFAMYGTLVGDPGAGDMYARLNNEVTVLARELARQKKQTEHELSELETAHWHIRKLGEVLPICVECGRIRVDDETWQQLSEFLCQHTTFLSHGYCPECLGQYEAEATTDRRR